MEAQAARIAEERLRLATEGAGVGTYDVDIDSGIGHWSPRAFALLGMSPTPDGAVELSHWLERIHEADRDRVHREHKEAAERLGAWQVCYRIIRADDGEVRWLDTYGQFTRTISGHTRSTGVVADITDKKNVEASLRDSENRLRRSQEAGGVGSYEWLMDGSGGNQSEQMLKLIGLNPGKNYTFKEVLSTVVAEDMEQVKATLLAIQDGTRRRETHYRVRQPGGSRWIRDVGQLEYDDSGKPYRWTGIVQDVTEQKRNEERQRLLINELNHRVKNTLAVVQAVAHQTFKADVSPSVARKSFEGRLASLAAAHDVLTRENWEPVSIREIVDAAASALSLAPGSLISSGPDLRVKPKTAVSLSMALHELGTNAIKYGCLTSELGRVHVTWSIGEDTLQFSWKEEGGPPPAPERRNGFGMRMIQQGLAAELGGLVDIQFSKSGLRCFIEAPLTNCIK